MINEEITLPTCLCSHPEHNLATVNKNQLMEKKIDDDLLVCAHALLRHYRQRSRTTVDKQKTSIFNPAAAGRQNHQPSIALEATTRSYLTSTSGRNQFTDSARHKKQTVEASKSPGDQVTDSARQSTKLPIVSSRRKIKSLKERSPRSRLSKPAVGSARSPVSTASSAAY